MEHDPTSQNSLLARHLVDLIPSDLPRFCDCKYVFHLLRCWSPQKQLQLIAHGQLEGVPEESETKNSFTFFSRRLPRTEEVPQICDGHTHIDNTQQYLLSRPHHVAFLHDEISLQQWID